MPVIKYSDIKFKINYEFTILETPFFIVAKHSVSKVKSPPVLII